MAKRKVKAQEHERLDDATISRVIGLLEQDNPITKKDACKILNIRYNTTRLNNIIQEFQDREAFAKKRYAQNRGKPVTTYEIKEIVLDYLKGVSVSEIGKSLFRSTGTINRVLDQYNVPRRKPGKGSYREPELIPDEAVSETFDVGELVWSARYNTVAEIRGITKGVAGPVYSIWIFGKYNERGYQPWWELGKLDILKELNITTTDISVTDRIQLEYR